MIRDERGCVLCVSETERDFWELPGGGLNHDKTVQQGMARELEEEIGYTGKFIYTYADITTLYADTKESCTMNIAFDVILADPDAICTGRDVYQMEYKDPKQFKDVEYRGGQLIYKYAVDRNFPIKFDRR